MFAFHWGNLAVVNLAGPIVRDGENGRTARELAGAVESMSGHERLQIRIDSTGGDCDNGCEMYALLRKHSLPVETIVTGAANSMAAIVALAGDHRVMVDGSRLEFHIPRYTATNEIHERGFHAFVKTISRRTGVSFTQAVEWLAAERSFTPRQAQAAGIIHRITG